MENVISNNQKFLSNKNRDSGIELFRILTMLVIVAHHYVVNSELGLVVHNTGMNFSNVFLTLFGCGGKTGINCFVMITGYFMCKSNITLKKFLKLFLEVLFYRVVIYFIFIAFGIDTFSVKEIIKIFLPIYSIGTGFTQSYLTFFLFIPFINIFIKNAGKKYHLLLLAILLCVYTIFPTFLRGSMPLNYVSWFVVIYLVGAYIRMYPCQFFDNKKKAGFLFFICIALSLLSVIGCLFLGNKLGLSLTYYFLADSNKFLAVITAFFAFLFFKNLNIGYNALINKIAASCFGVLLIHANSATMREWLWNDFLKNIEFYSSSFLVLHAVISVAMIYIVCTIIDMLRIKFLEKSFFCIYDKLILNFERKVQKVEKV